MDEKKTAGKRGELRVYLGAAPGVGKTFAMLGEAHRRRERGIDVVVGFVETHGRAKTAELLDGLEIVPRGQIHHHGVDFTDPELRLSTEDTAELMATVEESADRLTGLVGNPLDSSRLAADAVTPQLRPVGYDEVVAAALSGIDERRLVSVDVDERLPRVLADIGLLERVVANVIDNALRHGRLRPRRPIDVDGDGHVAVDEPEIAVRASTHGDHVELRVADHGPGPHKKVLDSVFTPFQRLGDCDATTGIGLGPSVAKGFVKATGGTITAEDTPGGGLTIVISLPVHEESAV
ncbi:Histidine kinase-, DNA gyrase B-, and HSP90-like ATPase [Lentzea albidocapillata]|uniref:histidine kinase n=1 Tax=Lentzea albidocapillata TaxID=40571 RepID=A0A1W2CKQ7_9PSEU|nr:Histidine kinase-, DNA gyrase B-, and HSP90-like ATPase [Lentzea albidocapillata]